MGAAVRLHHLLYTSRTLQLNTSLAPRVIADPTLLAVHLAREKRRSEEKSSCLNRRGNKMNHVRATRSIWRISAAARRNGYVSRRTYATEGQSIPSQPTPPKTPAAAPSPDSPAKPTSRTVCCTYYLPPSLIYFMESWANQTIN